MKHIKMLGLAAVAAMALTAYLGAASASATELYSGTTTQGKGTLIVATLAAGTSAILKDEAGNTTDTCTTSEVEGKIENAGSSTTHPSGKITKLHFTNCSHTTHTLANGSLEVKWTSGINGEVISSGAEVTVFSTFFGISCIAKTGAGTKLGTLTGSTDPKKDAIMDINATIPMGLCGNASWTGTYTVTSPTPLHVTPS